MRKVRFEVGYGSYVLLTMAEAEKVAAILDGTSVADYGYVGDKRVNYLKDEGYTTPLSFDDGTLYITESAFRSELAAHEAMQEQAKEKEDEKG